MMGMFKHIDDHMHMMGEMMRQTDVDVMKTAGPGGETFYRGAIVRCLFCKHGEECQSWLAENHEHAEPPAFCANADRFATLNAAMAD